MSAMVSTICVPGAVPDNRTVQSSKNKRPTHRDDASASDIRAQTALIFFVCKCARAVAKWQLARLAGLVQAIARMRALSLDL